MTKQENNLPFMRELPENWSVKKFEELLAEPLRNGIYKKKEFHGRGQKVINMGELFAYDFISNQEMKRVELNPKELEKYLVKDGDLLFARRSLVLEGSGKCSLVVRPTEDTTFESSIIRARLNKIQADSKFYYYLFRSPLGRALIASIASQTAVSGIAGSNLLKLSFPLPPLPTQRKIASILSAYDDLNENNTRRIKILEYMAQNLYHEWFVKFRYPGYERVKMVESALGLIPEGWKINKLGKIADINKLSIKINNAPEEINYIDIAAVSPGIINKIEVIAFENAPGRARRIVKHGDVIWSSVRPNRKSYALILNPAKNLIVSTGFTVISSTKLPYTYVYCAVTTDEFVGYLTNNATGSAYPAVNSNDFKNADILIPENHILEKFHIVVEYLSLQKNNLQRKNENLRKTRDLLLPKLISGEIDVENLDIDTTEIAT